jgi:hypothetical protein
MRGSEVAPYSAQTWQHLNLGKQSSIFAALDADPVQLQAVGAA